MNVARVVKERQELEIEIQGTRGYPCRGAADGAEHTVNQQEFNAAEGKKKAYLEYKEQHGESIAEYEEVVAKHGGMMAEYLRRKLEYEVAEKDRGRLEEGFEHIRTKILKNMSAEYGLRTRTCLFAK